MIKMHDLFCGGGGSTSGAKHVPGVRVVMAANHWKLAVDTHNVNHPDADHDCADVSQVDPRRYPAAEGLWGSPECTFHSGAAGRKRVGPDAYGDALPADAAERSRATMWDIVRFAEYHRYRFVVVENVIEAASWAPFQAWLQAMDALGYDHHIVCLNSMHAQRFGEPAPQSRDRLYINFWLRGQRRPDFERITSPQAWCPSCEALVESRQHWKRPGQVVGRYNQQYYYVCTSCSSKVEPGYLPALSIVDWTLPGERIGDRKKPLADKTMARIEAGLRKHLFTPMVVPVEGRPGKEAQSGWLPLRTQTTRAESGLLMPFIAELRGGHSSTRGIDRPLATVTAEGNHHGLVMPGFIMRNNGSKGDGGEHCTGLDDVLRTITTKGHQSVITWDLLMPYNRTGHVRSLAEATMTMTTVDRSALVASSPNVGDCYFRMLQPHEVAAAMAFASGYTLLGNKREQVKMCGNAVTPPSARDLIAVHVEALQGGVTEARPSDHNFAYRNA